MKSGYSIIFGKMKQVITLVMLCTFGLAACQTTPGAGSPKNIKQMSEVTKSEEEWKKTLTPDQYHILREKGTEAPGTGEFNHHSKKGFYTCAGCGAELFSSDQKFDSHCGWPSFDGELGGGDRVKKIKDFSHGMIRTEIVCARCGGHLGHLFDDGPTATGQRYCVNSLSLGFKAASDSTGAGKK
jgi:peptide-methionine (R)-S-oxide reductase